MALQRWDPFRELRHMEYAADRLWRGFGPRAGVPTSDTDSWGIPLDIVRDTDNVVVRASLAGVKPGDINVTIEDNLLTVKGSTETERSEGNDGTYLLRERRTGAFRARSVCRTTWTPTRPSPRTRLAC